MFNVKVEPTGHGIQYGDLLLEALRLEIALEDIRHQHVGLIGQEQHERVVSEGEARFSALKNLIERVSPR